MVTINELLFHEIAVRAITDEIDTTISVTRVAELITHENSDVNYTNKASGMPLIAHALTRKLNQVARLLINSGADLNKKCAMGIPPIVYALYSEPLVTEMVEAGTDLSAEYTSSGKVIKIYDVILDHAEKSSWLTLKDMIEDRMEQIDIPYVSSQFKLFDQVHVKKEHDREKSDSRRHFLSTLLATGSYRAPAKTYGRDSLDDMYEKFPNFSEAIDYFRRQVGLYELSENGITTMAPMLMSGPPGIGKTRFVRAISEAIGLEMHNISCGAISAGWVIGGSSTSWSEGRPGLVFASMRDGKTANPVVMLDEIDKLSGDPRYDGYGALYTLLERHTSSAFTDEALAVPIDCSKVSWVATANDVSTIPKPIQSRFSIIDIQAPDQKQMRSIINSIYQDILTDHEDSWGSRFSKTLSDEVIDELVEFSPREVYRRFSDAFGEAAVSRDCQTYDLISADFVKSFKTKRRIGF